MTQSFDKCAQEIRVLTPEQWSGEAYRYQVQPIFAQEALLYTFTHMAHHPPSVLTLGTSALRGRLISLLEAKPRFYWALVLCSRAPFGGPLGARLFLTADSRR